jgi:hypothetical protein
VVLGAEGPRGRTDKLTGQLERLYAELRERR